MRDTTLDDFRARMSKMVYEAGSIQKLAEAIGASESAVRKWRDGETEPTMRYLKQLSEVTRHSIEWIVNGRENQNGIDKSIMEPSANYILNQLSIIKRYEVEASAGSGSITTSEEEIEGIAFRTEWLRRRGLSPSRLAVITARGDSMSPTIQSGSLLLVDLSQKNRFSDGIYVIQVEGALMVKRIQGDLANGGLLILSDNPAYAQISLDQTRSSSVHIIGRAVWAGTDI